MKSWVSLCLALALCRMVPADVVQTLVEHVAAHPQGDALCSFDRRVFAGDTKPLPIGVFDSGIGGLTVLDEMLRVDVFDNGNLQPRSDGVRDFAAERFVYFGDQANMPYGNYPAAGRTELLRELILRDVVFLLRSEPGKLPVKAIVIACNTATAFGLDDIRAALKSWQIEMPVVGVVEAGARGVMELLPSQERPDAIAVLATVGTCGCEAYPRAISRATGLAGKPMPVIVQQGCVGLAGAIEGDPAFVGPGKELPTVNDHVRHEVTALVETHRKSGDTTPLGYVVLGCTHYPLVQKEIAAAFEQLRTYRDAAGAQPYAALIREKLAFINPAEFTAKELFRELARAKLRLKPGDKALAERDTFFMSVPNPDWPGVKLTATGALEADYKHGRALGDFTRNDTPMVPMTPRLLPATAAGAIQRLMPEVWQRVVAPANASRP